MAGAKADEIDKVEKILTGAVRAAATGRENCEDSLQSKCRFDPDE
jgi:hypothetical protein